MLLFVNSPTPAQDRHDSVRTFARPGARVASHPMTRDGAQATGRLPAWRCVLAVVAHPDDESFGLGGLLAAFGEQGARLAVLCFTRGEASTLHGVSGDLADIRAREIAAAAEELGVGTVDLHSYPDGCLPGMPVQELATHVIVLAQRLDARGLLVFDPAGVTGHPDHRQATAAACMAAAKLGLPVLGWTLPATVAETLNTECNSSFIGHQPGDIDIVVRVNRQRQHRAVLRHRSQALPTSVLWRRLDLLGPYEHTRWLRP